MREAEGKREKEMPFSFEGNQTVTDLSTVPEQYRPLYKEDDGKFTLDKNEQVGAAVEGLVSLDKALTDARKEARDHKAKVVNLDVLLEFGTSPDEILAGINAKVGELEGQIAGDGEARLNLDKIKDDLNKAHAKDLSAKDKRIDALTGQFHELMVKSAATTALAEAKGDTELLMPFVLEKAKIVEEDGEFNVFIADEVGDRRYSGTTGTPMTIAELVDEMKNTDRYGKLFESDKPTGGGKGPRSSAEGQIKASGETQTSVDKIQTGLDKRRQ